MTEAERCYWLTNHGARTNEDFIAKFEAGQREHGGDIGHVPTTKLLAHIEEEAIDQLAYVKEIRRRMLATTSPQNLKLQICNILHRRLGTNATAEAIIALL